MDIINLHVDINKSHVNMNKSQDVIIMLDLASFMSDKGIRDFTYIKLDSLKRFVTCMKT